LGIWNCPLSIAMPPNSCALGHELEKEERANGDFAREKRKPRGYG
jgi:hypothetical protein